MTTIKPELLSGNATGNLLLAPTAIGDSGLLLDLGYHYPGVHYAANVTLDNQTALLTNGVVVATYGDHGFWLKGGSELVSEGKPRSPNYLIPYQLVQEGSVNWGNTPPNIIQTFNLYQPGSGTGPNPRVTLRFTVVDRHVDGAYQLFTGDPWRAAHVEIRDCRLIGGQLYVIGSAGYSPVLGLTNNLLEHVYVDVIADPDIYFYNNLFLSSQLDFEKWESGYPGGGDWIVADNVFDRCLIQNLYDPWSGHHHNGYVSCALNNWPIDTGVNGVDVAFTDLAYEVGTGGKYYLPASSSLINHGSRTPGAAGLFHYTTSKTAGTKEGVPLTSPNAVDIGFHFVGLDASGKPIDTDGSSVPDYFEDRNGNGNYDPGSDALVGETDWQTPFDIIANFPGIKQEGESEARVPDTIGAVGPSHFMVVLNGDKSVAVYDKNTGVRVSPVSTTAKEFFSLNVETGQYAGPHPGPAYGIVDPRILYDHASQRWIACAIETGSALSPYYQNVLLAISNGPDPVGEDEDQNQWVSSNWTKYLVPLSNPMSDCDNDRDILGVDTNGIYITATDNLGFCAPTVRIAALPKAQFLDGTAPTVLNPHVLEVSDFGGEVIMYPAVNFESIAPTDPAWFILISGANLVYNGLTWNNGPDNPPNWVFPTQWSVLPITEPFRELKLGLVNIDVEGPQLSSTSTAKADIDSRLMMASVRKLNGIQYLWTCHAIGVNKNGTHGSPPDAADRSGIAWYKIRLDTMVEIVASERIYDLAPSSPKHYYYPSLAVNSMGEMLLGFSGSSDNDHIGAYYVWRHSSGGTAPPTRYFSGRDYFLSGSPVFGWGDYSFTTPDPDGVRLWTIQEFAEEQYSAEFDNAWGTRILGIHP